MEKLLLIVVAVVWIAVLIPPLLRSRVDNHPSSSVTDFRRQLNRLESSATPQRGVVRSFGRPLAQSPLARQAAPGRPGQPAGVRQAPVRSGGNGPVLRDRTGETNRYRTHGDASGGQRRPQRADERRPRQADERRPRQADERRPRQADERRPQHADERRPQHADDRRPQRADDRRPQHAVRGHRSQQAGNVDSGVAVKRRRMNVMFGLVVVCACALFLALTTDLVAMQWVFGVSFLATALYLYVLSKLRDGEVTVLSQRRPEFR